MTTGISAAKVAGLAAAQADRGAFTLAADTARRALREDEECAAAHYELGHALLRARGSRPDVVGQAIAHLCRAIDLDPMLACACSQLAHAYALEGRWADAVSADRRALELTSAAPPLPVPPDLETVGLVSPTGDELPIVMFTRELGVRPPGFHHLAYAAAEARRANPRSRVIVIGDGTNRLPFVEHHQIIDHSERAQAFAGVYRHLAFPTRYDFILFCFQRWFVLLDFMEALHLDACLHIDPDVLLLTDVAQLEAEVPGRVDFALSANPVFGISPHYNYITSRAALARFCDFTFGVFAQASPAMAVSPMQAAIRAGKHSYVTDMTAFAELSRARLAQIHNLSRVRRRAIWDANVASADGFAFRNGVKDVTWRGCEAYCRQLSSGREIRFHALHFNYDTKRLMPAGYHRRRLGLGFMVKRTQSP